jgi:hypothetical protein
MRRTSIRFIENFKEAPQAKSECGQAPTNFLNYERGKARPHPFAGTCPNNYPPVLTVVSGPTIIKYYFN